MPSNMDSRTAGPSAPLAGPETRDASFRGVFSFLIILGIVLVCSGLVSWGMFQYFAAQSAHQVASASPFSEARQLPAGVQLQVHPRRDLEEFEARQKAALESYAWVDRSAGTVRVPIELAMQLLLKKGLPVATTANSAPPAKAKSTAAGKRKP